jgi:hypothetical protein
MLNIVLRTLHIISNTHIHHLAEAFAFSSTDLKWRLREAWTVLKAKMFTCCVSEWEHRLGSILVQSLGSSHCTTSSHCSQWQWGGERNTGSKSIMSVSWISLEIIYDPRIFGWNKFGFFYDYFFLTDILALLMLFSFLNPHLACEHMLLMLLHLHLTKAEVKMLLSLKPIFCRLLSSLWPVHGCSFNFFNSVV